MMGTHKNCQSDNTVQMILTTSIFYRPPVKQNMRGKIVNIFLPISLNICFGCTKEPSQWDGSFEYPQRMFWLKIKKTIFAYTHLSGGLISAWYKKIKWRPLYIILKRVHIISFSYFLTKVYMLGVVKRSVSKRQLLFWAQNHILQLMDSKDMAI